MRQKRGFISTPNPMAPEKIATFIQEMKALPPEYLTEQMQGAIEAAEKALAWHAKYQQHKKNLSTKQ